MSTKLTGLTIKLFRNEQLVVDMFAEGEIYQLHFEEGISRPFSGKAFIRTQKRLYRSQYDVNGLSALIKVEITDSDDAKNVKSRNFFAKVRTLKYRGTAEFTKSNGEHVVRKVYEMDLVSPLEALAAKRNDGYFYNKTVPEIVKELLKHTDSAAADYDHSYVLDTDRLTTPDWLNLKNLMVEQYDESNLSFLHRLMRVYGLNYVFSDGVANSSKDALKLLFTHDGSFSDEASFEREIVEMSAGVKYGDKIPAEQINFMQAVELEDDTSDTQSLQILGAKDDRDASAARVEAIALENLKRMRKLGASAFTCTVESPEIRAGMLLKLENMFSGENVTAKFLTVSTVTDVTALTDAVHPFEVKVYGIPAESNEWVPGSFATVDAAVHAAPGGSQQCRMAKAVICNEKGETDSTSEVAEIAGNDNTLENDWFYVKLENSDKVVIARNTYGGASVKATELLPGKRVLLNYDRGVFYLDSFLAEDLSAQNTVSGMLAQYAADENKKHFKDTVYSDDDIGSIVFSKSGSMRDYIASELAAGSVNIDRLVTAQAISKNSTDIFDKKYAGTAFNSADDSCKSDSELTAYTGRGTYQKVCQLVYEAYAKALDDLTAALKSYNGRVKLLETDKYDPTSDAYKDKVAEYKKEAGIDDKQTALKNAEDDVTALAARLIKYFGLSESGGTQKQLSLTSNGGIALDANGDLKISANKVVIDAESDVNINTKGSIRMDAKKEIRQEVTYSTISLKSDGAAITAPAALGGYKMANEDCCMDMMTSTLKVKSYGGVKISARNVKISGSDTLKLSGSLGAGVKLGWGMAKVAGASVALGTDGRFDMIKNYGEYVEEFLEELGKYIDYGVRNKGKDKNGEVDDKYREGVETGLNVVHAAWDTGWNAKDIVDEIQDFRDKKDVTAYDWIDTVCKVISSCLDICETFCEMSYQINRYQYVAQQQEAANEEEAAKVTKNPFYAPGETLVISKLDLAKLYITHIKAVMGLTQAMAAIVRVSGNGALFDESSKFVVSPFQIKGKTDKFEMVVNACSSYFNRTAGANANSQPPANPKYATANKTDIGGGQLGEILP